MRASDLPRQSVAHPARTLLFVNGGFYMLWSLPAIPVGMFVGWHILIPGLLLALTGMWGISLSNQDYDAETRRSTIGWSVLMSLAMLAFAMSAMSSIQDWPAALFVFGAVALVFPVLWITLTTPAPSPETSPGKPRTQL